MARVAPQPDLATPNGGSMLYLAGVCLVASLGGLLFGFDTAVVSGTVELVEKRFFLDKVAVGWFVSSALLGCILGAAISGVLSDRFGRKPILVLSALCFFLCAVLCAVAETFGVLVWGRMIGGVGVGMASVLSPMFISEFSPPRLRGRLVALYQLSIVIGILAAYFSNWLLLSQAQRNCLALVEESWWHWVMVADVWRAMFGVGIVPATLFFLLLLFVPESPRWLAKAGRDEQARKILTRIAGRKTADCELAEIRKALLQEKGSLKELFQPGLRVALIVALGLAVFGQLSGVNIVVYYGPEILTSAGFPLQGAFQWQVALGVINLIFTVIAILVVDSGGRRPLLVGGMGVVTLTLGMTGLLLWSSASALWIVIVLGIYMAFEALSICAVIWVITAEIFPNRIRGQAMSLATFATWGTNLVNVFVFPSFMDRCGAHTGFFAYSAICLVATLFFWKFVPETKGKSLEEIERHWLARE